MDATRKQKLLEQAQIRCRENGGELLYLTLFGSTLYGTSLPGKSDVDVRGVFLPSRASLVLEEAAESLHFSTGNGCTRNVAEDVDLDLWSVQRWLLKLLPGGDIGALDVLFSPSNPACTLYRDPRLDKVFSSPLKLVDMVNGRAYAEYSLGQARQYGIKGSRVGALKAVRRWLKEHCPEPPHGLRLRDILPALAASCADGKYCALVESGKGSGIRLIGKLHEGGITVREFAARVEADMRRDGERALLSEQGRGVDFKALSHALRALDQMEELLATGTVVFPLKSRAELLAVKRGEYNWKELEPRILDRLRAVDALRKTAPHAGCFEPDFARAQVLACYSEFIEMS